MQTYLSVFLIGLLGSMHCIGMCGGFVAMYSLRKPASRPSLPYHLLYNLGRLTTYSLLGGVMGLIGSFGAYLGRVRGIPGAVLLIAGIVMIVMGLNSAGVLGRGDAIDGAAVTERGFFRTGLRGVLAMESPGGIFRFGLLLGFLPCGLLYPVFFSAAASGGALSGMATLFVFGLGTVPAMLSLGMLVTKIRPRIKLLLYRLAAALIILLGVQTFLRGMAFNGWIPPGNLW